MSEAIVLEASPREVVGKKVKRLRQAGLIPVIVYGPDFAPAALSIEEKALRHALTRAGGTQIVELQVGKETIPVLAREVQRDPVRGNILHVDFYRVAMDRLIRAEIPLVFVNEPPLVASNEAIVVQMLNSVEVEALPRELPPHIEVDLSVLTEIGDHILAGDLIVPEGVAITTEAEELVARLDYAQALEEEVEEEMLLEPEAAEVEVITEKKEEEEESGE